MSCIAFLYTNVKAKCNTGAPPLQPALYLLISSIQSHLPSCNSSIINDALQGSSSINDSSVPPSHAGWLHPSGGGPPAGPWPGGLPATGERYKGQGTPACPAHRRPQGWHQGRGPASAERPQRGCWVQGEWRCQTMSVSAGGSSVGCFIFFISLILWLFNCFFDYWGIWVFICQFMFLAAFLSSSLGWICFWCFLWQKGVRSRSTICLYIFKHITEHSSLWMHRLVMLERF